MTRLGNVPPAPDRAGLREAIQRAEQAVRDHEAEPYPDRPDGGWYWTRDAAHLGGRVSGLKEAAALLSEPPGLDVERLAEAAHNVEQRSFAIPQEPLSWQDCINANEHRAIATEYARLTEDSRRG